MTTRAERASRSAVYGDVDRRLGARIKALRLSRKMNLVQLAGVIGTQGHAAVWAIERGERCLRPAEILAISREFGVSTDDLLSEAPFAVSWSEAGAEWSVTS